MRGALMGKADDRTANARAPVYRPGRGIGFADAGTAAPRGCGTRREAQGAGRVQARGNGSVTYGR